jgi:hypothetical protein
MHPADEGLTRVRSATSVPAIMKAKLALVGILGAGVLAFAGCGGDDDDGLTCGPGTVEQDGQCVPTDDLECATGTVEVDGECVPDGSVICDQGTTFDETTGTCVADLDECGAGTVEVDGVCVPFDDTLVGDVSEGAEPNDPDFGGTPGSLTLPDVGDTLTVDGCIEPADFDDDGVIDIDNDVWVVTVDAPALFDFTIDGTGGASAGFGVFPGDAALAADGWARFGINLTSDGAQRQIYLPKAGTYALLVSDARSLFLGEPAGGPDACYFLQIEGVAIPSATPLTGGNATGDLGDVQFYSLNGTEGQLLFNTLTANTAAAQGSLVQLVDGAYVNSVNDVGGGAATFLSGLEAGAGVTLVVDDAFNYAFNPVPFDLTAQDAGAQAAGTVTITHNDEFFQWVYFEATAGDLVHLTFSGGTDGFDLLVADPNLASVGQICTNCSDFDEWVQVGTTGFHYLRLFNLDGNAGADYEVVVSNVDVTPAAVTIDTTAAGSLAAEGLAAFEVTPTDWVEYNVANATGFTTGEVQFFPRDGARLLGIATEVDFGFSDDVPFGRIDLSGDTFLVTVKDLGGGTSGSTFDFDVTTKAFTDLGTVDTGTPVNLTGESIGADETGFYLVRPSGGANGVTVTGTSGFDAVVDNLSRVEGVLESADETGADGIERFNSGAPEFIAFAVTEFSGAAGSYDVDVVRLREITGSGTPGLAFGASPTFVSDTITLTDGTPCTVAAISVDVDISHDYRGDVVLDLTHVASDTTRRLKGSNGGDSADDVIGNFPGTLALFESLEPFNGLDALGDWTLTATDAFPSADDGVVNSWSVNVACE